MELSKFLEKTNGKYFYVMDTETTGFSASNADVIEVSALKVLNNNGKFIAVDEFDSFINPGYPLPQLIVEFNQKNGTGICDALLATKPYAKEVAGKLYAFLHKEGDDLYVVGHNLDKFDVPFITKLMAADHKGFDPITFDTLTYAKANIAGKHNLGVLFEQTNKEHSNGNPVAHLSIGDCYMTLDVMEMEKGMEKDLEKAKGRNVIGKE